VKEDPYVVDNEREVAIKEKEEKLAAQMQMK
jgi:hypothetical protein